jgi:deazaflavin-dependent oxidoreductase (nitroreductase family)
VPADILMKAMNAVHRRSGLPRSVLLTTPARDGDTLVVVASRGGDDRHPDWLLNLRADPRVEVAVQGGPRRPMLARIAAGPERGRLWARITTTNPRYAAYQRRTSREIPVVVLDPAD